MSLPVFSPGRGSALPLHFVGRLPGADDHFADPSHGLRIRRHHADRAQIVQNVFRGDGFGADARFGERHVFRNRGTEMMADHQHVQVLVQRIHRERHGRIRRGGKAVRLAADVNDVRRVAAAGAFGVIRVDGAALERANRILHEAGFVERVGVNRHLHVEFIRDGKRAIDGSGRRSPIFVEFQSDRAGQDLLAQRLGKRSIALAEKTEIDRKALGGLQHAMNIPGSGRARCGIGSGGRPGAAADQRGQACRKSGPDKLRANKVDVRINAARGDDFSFAGDRFRARADNHSWSDAAHDVGIAGLADCLRSVRRGFRCPP